MPVPSSSHHVRQNPLIDELPAHTERQLVGVIDYHDHTAVLGHGAFAPEAAASCGGPLPPPLMWALWRGILRR